MRGDVDPVDDTPRPPFDSGPPLIEEGRPSLAKRPRRQLATLLRWPRVLVTLVAIVVAVGLARHFLISSANSKIFYHTAEVSRGSISATISASGTVRPQAQVSIVAQTPGQVADVLVDFNAHVKAGDVLARLKSDVAEARLQMANADLDVARGSLDVARETTVRAQRDVDNARANVVSARADVDRAGLSLGDANTDLKRKQELARTGDAARVETERAKTAASQAGAGVTSAKAHQTAAAAALASAEAAAQVAQAQEKNAAATLASREAAVRQSQLDVEQTSIRTPIDGVVIDRNAVVGQAVAAGAGAPPMFTIANDLSEMEVHASIDEADIGRVSVGQPARFGFDAFPGQQFVGKVVEIRKTPQVVQNVVSYDVVLSVTNEGQKLLPGMTADVRIVAGERKDVLTVPNAALRFRPPADSAAEAANGPVVWHLQSGRAEPVKVTIGLSDGVETEITSGDISAGEKIIVGSGKVKNDDRASVGPLKF